MPESNGSERHAAVARGLMDAVRALYGDRLSAEEEERVADELRRMVEAAEALRRVPLTNADEPDVLFRPYRGEG